MRLIILSFIIFLVGCPKKSETSEESFHRYDLEEFDKLMENTNIFAKYCYKNNRELSIMVNPMRNNFEEMVNLFIKIYF